MHDDYTTRGMVIRSALRLAEKKGWRGLTLADIASDAGVSLADIHRDFGSRTGILIAFISDVDKAVLKQSAPIDPDTLARDRIFDVLMTRLDILKPYKGALARIHADCRCMAPDMSSARLLCASLNSHDWMLNAAGIPASGPRGGIRLTGMARLYGRVLTVWFNDDDSDMAKTMAALDNELSAGECWLKRLDALCMGLGRIACRFAPRRKRRETQTEQPAAG